MRTRRTFFLGKHPFLEIASERTLTNRSPVAALSKITEGGKPTESIDIYIYIKRIDRWTEWGNSHPRIREKEISISTCRNGYAAVNRLVAPPPHKYSIKFIRTNISSSRPTRNLITIYGHVLYPVTDSSLPISSPTEIPNRSNYIRFCLRIHPLYPSNPNSSVRIATNTNSTSNRIFFVSSLWIELNRSSFINFNNSNRLERNTRVQRLTTRPTISNSGNFPWKFHR